MNTKEPIPYESAALSIELLEREVEYLQSRLMVAESGLSQVPAPLYFALGFAAGVTITALSIWAF